MQPARATLPPEVRRLSGLYRIIAPSRFAEMGIDREDVPMGTFPAEDHPPFLPDRFGGNAYGLGLYEQDKLSGPDELLLESVDLTEPAQVAGHYRQINNILKRLGLLIRYSRHGRPFYLIPRQYVAHFLVELQAKADVIVEFLSHQFTKRLRENLRVALISADPDMLLPEVQSRMPGLEFRSIRNLEDLARRRRVYDSVVMVGDLRDLLQNERLAGIGDPTVLREQIESYGYFLASRAYDLLEENSELLVICDRPLSTSRQAIRVDFRREEDFKRFLAFSHVFRTRRRYRSKEGASLTVNRFDFNAFLMGLGAYHETIESTLGGRPLAKVDAAELDHLPYQDLPLPRGSTPRLMGAWRRWFEPFFQTGRLETVLPAVQRGQWEERYGLKVDLPETLVVFQGVRRRPQLTLDALEHGTQHGRLVGCRRQLLAPYKDTFGYVLKVLGILEQVRDNVYKGLPAPEMARLREPFETGFKHEQLGNTLQMMALAPRLFKCANYLNPDGLMGEDTPMLANLEKLSLLGIEDGVLVQLYLTVLGHSTLSRVVFGKLSKTSLAPLSDVRRHSNLQEAVSVIRLYRLMSVAESAAASPGGLTEEQTSEFFRLCDDAVRISSQPDLDWSRLQDMEINRLGGVQAEATRKLLKLLNLFEFMDNWREVAEAGPHRREAMADFDPQRIRGSQLVLELAEQMGRFVGHYYAGDSSARPYFFRALLNCELHGTGRLLPRLGPSVAFTLLWICLHAMQRRVLNFNPLLDVERPEDLSRRLAILRRALNGLTPQHLSPGWLYRLREGVSLRGEAYVFDTGLHLVWDPKAGALTVQFLDPDEDLSRLTGEVEQLYDIGLSKIPGHLLTNMDRRADRLAHFLEALGRGRGLRPSSAERRERLSARLEEVSERREKKVLDELGRPNGFWPILQRMAKSCPRLLQRWLPEPLGSARNRRRLAAAAKLGALLAGRHDQFQDMQLSHELARVEFGPTAAGIVGVTPLQFQMLLGTMQQLRQRQPALVRLMMLALLVYNEGEVGAGPQTKSPLISRVGLTEQEDQDLQFLVEHYDRLRQVIMGEACLNALEPLVERADPLLNEALFLMGVITTAGSREGLLTEDLLERFFDLADTVRNLVKNGSSALKAHLDLLKRHARESRAFENYREIQEGEAPSASLRYLLDTVSLPSDQSLWVHEGRLQAGLERLLRMRGLLFVDPLDVLMLRHEVPVNFIYRLKNLRSEGVTHFHRDLYEGLLLYRGLKKLPQNLQEFLLLSLSDPDQPIRLVGFAQAASKLNYSNQTRLLWLGLLGIEAVEEIGGHPVTVSFKPLAEVIQDKFETVNEAVSRLSPQAMLADTGGMRRLLGASEGLSLRYESGSRTLLVDHVESTHIGLKIVALRRAEAPGELKELYHRELRELKLTSHETIDYQHRLERAFNESLSRLGQAMVEKVRAQMARVEDLASLEELYHQAREEGLELPLSEDRLQSLGDLYELNLERLRNVVLEQMGERLGDVADLRELEAYWQETKHRLRRQRRFFGRSFELALAERFDRRRQELSEPGDSQE